MAGKHVAVFGIFGSHVGVKEAVDALTRTGFSNQDVSVLMSDKEDTKNFATEKNTKVPEGTTAGVGLGGVLGGTFGVLAGVGVLAIPGVGPLIAAGPIMAGLAGLGVGGTVGGLVGALVGLGIPEYEAKRYEGWVNDGGVLVSVHCGTSEEVTKAKQVLKAAGAEDISWTGDKSISSHGVEKDPAQPEDNVRTISPRTTRVG